MIITDNLGFNERRLILPRGKIGLSPLELDMTKIFEVESRIREIERSTPATMPNLIADFILGSIEASRLVALIEMELKEAQHSMDKANAIALLERAEDILKAKNIKSSADTREAAVNLDPDVRDARYRVDVLKTMSTFLMAKKDAIEMAYHGAKKICDIYLRSPGSISDHAGGEG